MSSNERRAAARRRAWGRGPIILRFEPLEGRQLLATSVVGPSPDLLATSFNTVHTADWGDLIHATGTIANQGTATTIAPVSHTRAHRALPAVVLKGWTRTLTGFTGVAVPGWPFPPACSFSASGLPDESSATCTAQTNR